MMQIKPDPRDYESVRREYGEPKTDAERADHYRLAQATKLLRLYNAGLLSPEKCEHSTSCVKSPSRQ